KLLGTLREVTRRAIRIAAVLKREQCQVIVACSGDLVDIPASYVAARWLGLPLVAYMFDDYTTQWTLKFPQAFAQWVWRRMAGRTTRVIVPNEFLAASYHQRYGIDPVVIHNAAEDVPDDDPEQHSWPEKDGAIQVVYTGAVYEAHYDAFRSLLAAL